MNGDVLPIEIMARREDWAFGVSIRVRQRTVGEGMMIAEPVVMRKAEKGEFVSPMLHLDIQAAQQLMDELWQCGLRPTEGAGSAGSLRATERHLEDMRTLVFSRLPDRPDNTVLDAGGMTTEEIRKYLRQQREE